MNKSMISEMSLRDQIAIKALSALITGRSWDGMTGDRLIERWAKSAYAVADAMLAEREKGIDQ